jgi:hypothetical protein
LLNVTTVSFLLAKGTGDAGQIEIEDQYFFFCQVMFSPSTLQFGPRIFSRLSKFDDSRLKNGQRTEHFFLKYAPKIYIRHYFTENTCEINAVVQVILLILLSGVQFSLVTDLNPVYFDFEFGF